MSRRARTFFQIDSARFPKSAKAENPNRNTNMRKKLAGLLPGKPKDFLGEGFEAPKLEEKILEFWKANDIFEKSLKLQKGNPASAQATEGRGRNFVFYEGPPSANGRPGLHHVISRVFKDIICRYKTMQGFYVPRKSGWDTHGLPVEIAAEKALGLKNKKEIEEYGIAEFNRKCREMVWDYKNEWEKFTDRIGFWLDLKDPYITYDNSYMESLWWIMKRFAEDDLLYQGHKIVNWCPRCGTGLSSHELAQGYKEVIDQSAYLKFRVKPGQSIRNWAVTEATYILAWTTTPWTLPGNLALAVGDDIDYVLVRSKERPKETYILAKDRLSALGMPTEGATAVKGRNLVGLEYEPLFEVPSLRSPKSYKVYPADFVSTGDGTGVVHTAVMYGEDDYRLGLELGLPQKHTVAGDGRFTEEVPELAGMYVKAKETEEKIFEHLRGKNYLLKIESYAHEYPHCWRCETPLLYYARTSWFVAVNKVRSKLLANNETINWVPAHLKRGRFGEWLKEKKDWNFSRERYWGTPLPVWMCGECKHWRAIGSLDELSRSSAEKPRNRYWVMRHGEGEQNVFGIIDPGTGNYHLTAKGKKQAGAGAKDLASLLRRQGRKIDLIAASSVLRAQETAKIVSKALGCEVLTEPGFKEIQLPSFAGKPGRTYLEAYPSSEKRFAQTPPKGENLNMLRKRVWDALQKLEKKFSGKNILIVSHEDPIWMLTQAAEGWSEKEAIDEKIKRRNLFIDTGEWRELEIISVPRDETGLLDMHRPYVDEVVLKCKECGGEARRVKEVVDVWYDSGAMPFAQWHYPFEHKSYVDHKERFPAEYICEAVDQTRGWFYTLLAVSTLLGKEAPYKNVISLGHINDKHGQKMSKSKGNVIDPWEIISQYGIDAVRWYLYTATPPGEPKNFDPQEVLKTLRRFHTILYNSFVYWRTYADKNAGKKGKPDLKNPLDLWIMARLEQVKTSATADLEAYRIREAGIALEELLDDLSRWYIRRSRRRFASASKGYGAGSDHKAASWTLGFALREMSKLIAPMSPFFAEALYQSISANAGLKAMQSVHLEEWPEAEGKKASRILEQMAEVRRLASLALAERAEAGIKVKQPLQTLWVKSDKEGLKNETGLLEILRDEVNVKEVAFNAKLKKEVALDTKITPELRAEGVLRELVRSVQDLRQKAGSEPKDRIRLMLELPEELAAMIRSRENSLKLETGAKEIVYKRDKKFAAEAETKLEDKSVWIGLRKA